MSLFHLQDLIDKARIALVGNRTLLQRMQTSSGLPPINDSEDLAYTNLNQVILQSIVYDGHIFYFFFSFFTVSSFSGCPDVHWTFSVIYNFF